MNRLLMKALLSGVLMCTALTAFSQIQTPAPSPTAELKQRVGLTDVVLLYSRPSVKDRIVFADNGIVPFGQVWRTGANSATKLSFSDPVKLGGIDLKKGDYTILTTPGAAQWKVAVYAYEGASWNIYTSKTPVGEFMATPEKLSNKVESFTMDLNNLRNESATIDLSWEYTRVSLPLSVEVDARVMASIDRVMAGPSAGDYSAAATYYFDNKKDLNKALEWIQKANAMGTPAYWTLHREAMILGELGRKKEAIAVAERSMAEAMKAKDDTYVRLNKEAIAKWSK